tara:strand:+ start:253 stop:363 length:111 start_codon:yes stop_codon:yes gene_type:complete
MHNLEERRMSEEFNELNLATVVAEHKEWLADVSAGG